jgi:hypothetical protein
MGNIVQSSGATSEQASQFYLQFSKLDESRVLEVYRLNIALLLL